MRQLPPGGVLGTLPAPPSKSAMQRAVAAACLAGGETTLLNPSFCDDGLAALAVAESLGSAVDALGDRVVIRGGAHPRAAKLDCGESGLCLRMFSPIAALFPEEIELGARGSLLGRPAAMIEPPLRALGAACSTLGGKPPVRVRGPLRAGAAEIDGSVSSQLLTGLLMALPTLEGDSELRVKELKSKPYVRMTLELLRDFGIAVDASPDLSRFRIRGSQRFQPRTYRIEGDWSGAAFLLVAGAIAGQVEITGLSLTSAQADRAILDALTTCGARVSASGDRVEVEQANLRGFQFDATECPDLLPPLAALATCCPGTTTLKGASRLRHKESDRAAALVEELGAVGARIHTYGDLLVIEGGPLRGGAARSRGDHRIAMAVAVAALATADGARLEGEDAVSKSYPGFFSDLDALRRKA